MSTSATSPAAQQSGDKHHTSNEASPNGERNSNGQFAAGNRGGPGNPFGRRAAEHRKAFQEAVTREDMDRVCQRLIAQAALGDIPSIKLFLSYTLGKVPEPVNPDTVDHEEVRMHLQNLTGAELQRTAQTTAPPRVSLGLLRGMTIVHEENAGRILDKQESAAARKEAKAERRSADRNEVGAPTTEADEAELVEAFANLPAAAQPGAPQTSRIRNGLNGESLGKRQPSPYWKQCLSGRRKG